MTGRAVSAATSTRTSPPSGPARSTSTSPPRMPRRRWSAPASGIARGIGRASARDVADAQRLGARFQTRSPSHWPKRATLALRRWRTPPGRAAAAAAGGRDGLPGLAVGRPVEVAARDADAAGPRRRGAGAAEFARGQHAPAASTWRTAPPRTATKVPSGEARGRWRNGRRARVCATRREGPVRRAAGRGPRVGEGAGENAPAAESASTRVVNTRSAVAEGHEGARSRRGRRGPTAAPSRVNKASRRRARRRRCGRRGRWRPGGSVAAMGEGRPVGGEEGAASARTAAAARPRRGAPYRRATAPSGRSGPTKVSLGDRPSSGDEDRSARRARRRRGPPGSRGRRRSASNARARRVARRSGRGRRRRRGAGDGRGGASRGGA